jgi:hypothetical protein
MVGYLEKPKQNIAKLNYRFELDVGAGTTEQTVECGT